MCKKLSTKNGIAALRQEAFRADRHFLMLQTLFEAIIPQKRKDTTNFCFHTGLDARTALKKQLFASIIVTFSTEKPVCLSTISLICTVMASFNTPFPTTTCAVLLPMTTTQGLPIFALIRFSVSASSLIALESSPSSCVAVFTASEEDLLSSIGFFERFGRFVVRCGAVEPSLCEIFIFHLRLSLLRFSFLRVTL